MESRTGYSASYTYDANGNRATRTVGGVTETYTNDSGDKLTGVSWSGGSKSYGYDGAGRTTSIVTSAGTTTLSYDYESRVTGITYPSSATNSFGYNGFDARISKTDSAGTSTYRRLGAGATSAVLGDGSASFTPGLSERRGSTTTFQHNGIKNADAQTGTGQTVGATRQYYAFGNIDSSTGTFQGPFGYGGGFGYQSDADSNLKLLGHRYYDSSTGRFLTRDRVKEGRAWYNYCSGGPIAQSDPSGLTLITIGGAGQYFWMFAGGDVFAGLVLDTDDWHLGSTGGIGAETGIGRYIGVSAFLSWDNAGSLTTGPGLSSPAYGVVTPKAFSEMQTDGNGNTSGGSIGGSPFGGGYAAYVSHRATQSFDATEWLGNIIGGWWGNLTAPRSHRMSSGEKPTCPGLEGGDPNMPFGAKRIGNRLMLE